MVGITLIIPKAACQGHCISEMKAKFTLVDDCFVFGKHTYGPLLSRVKARDLVLESGRQWWRRL